MSNVRISQLNGFTTILGEDFFPLIDSSSLTTYRTTVNTLVGYFALSGSVLSSSWASQSISASFSLNTISASYAKTASFLNYPNISTASAAISSSYSLSGLSASYAKSSSAANSASFSTSNFSSSCAKSSSVADTASYFNFSIGIPPFASSSMSSSWASQSLSSYYSSASLSSSYSLTSSYVESVYSAKVLCTISSSGTGYVWAGYNVSGVRYHFTGSLNAGGNTAGRFLVTFTRPLRKGYIAIANGSQKQYAELTSAAGNRYIEAAEVGSTSCAFLNSQSLYVETWGAPTVEADNNNINLVVYGEWSGSGAGYPPITYTASNTILIIMKDKLIPARKFHIVLGFTALLIALCAGVFSVYGIGTLFAGAAISVMVMASSLEIGKLVATTFLYRYWTKCSKLLKSYLVISILTLMAITSLGIFGYLSSAYQKSSIEFSITQEKIKNVEGQKTFYSDKIESSKKRVVDLTKLRASQESRLGDVLTNEFLTRNPLQLKQLQQQTIDLIASTDKDIKDEQQKIQASVEDINKINLQVNDLKLGSASKKDVQTFKFVADALGVSLDNVARWFIISIIFVFDPLAICLVLAYNVAVYRKEDETVYDAPKTEPITNKVLLHDSKPLEEQSSIISAVTESIVHPSTPKSDDSFFNSYFKR